jgi:hypothetical protein
MNAEKKNRDEFPEAEAADELTVEDDCAWLRDEEYEDALREVAWATLDLVRGISREQKERIYQFMRRTDSYKVNGGWVSTPDYAADAFEVIKNSDWEWVEWTFWQPILAERNLMTGGMRNNCHPQVYVFDPEKERENFSVKDFIRGCSGEELSRMFAKFPETASFTDKEQFTGYLYANPEAFSEIIDKRLKDMWSAACSRYDQRPSHIFALLWETVFARHEDLMVIRNIGAGPLHWDEAEGSDLYDDILDLPVYRLSQSPEFKDRNPWQMPGVMPNVPGLYFERR